MLRTVLDRIGWNERLRPFLYKELPAGTGWSATLGSLCALLFLVLVVSGAFLAMYYNPSPDKAYQTVDFIMRDVPMGALLRGIHHWGAGAMVLAVCLHLAHCFFSGSYKAPREGTWIVGVCLLLVTLGLGFTGYLLPWDMKAYWATVVSSNIPRDIPVVGDVLTRALLGGEVVSGLTLTRFYAIHTLFLPAVLAVLVVAHIYLIRLHGMAEHPGAAKAPAQAGPYRFYPEHTFRSALVFAGVFCVILLLSVCSGVVKEEIAGTLIESYLPRPEWYYMWLFQLLTYFSGAWEVVGSLAVPFLGVTLLFVVPFLGKGRLRGLANQPLCTGVGVTCVIAIVYLTLMGFEGVRPYGKVIPVPDRALTASEKRGLFLYADRECAYCHQIDGKGGHRTGPDMANMTAKHRTQASLADYVKNPQAVSATSIMPKYDLPEADLRALADFILALDFGKHPVRLLSGQDVLKSGSAQAGTDNGRNGARQPVAMNSQQ
ncbi:cytochrome b N-terminal domain-containing protein [Solidesulfovibrio sp.]|uniref:cytochrome b N-terminal domain-containing protein n=1 Tax=Solidesulfovibrio sp. TaxID=2910990 RepID=UPI00262EA4A1|nr:cytochrome b N-terminal domain-containing protein [Solidesulfovibrio sp.]